MWTAEMDAELMKLRAMGLSQAQIARSMGVTRNAVVGRLWRMMGRKRAPGTNLGRPIGGGRPKVNQVRSGCQVWDERTFAPYARWKEERKRERELGLR